MKKINVALAGNPNSGKSTIFNMLTGGRQKVGNYPGVTVEIKEGKARRDDYEINFIDLPGTYSLTAYTLEERVARDFIINKHPDVVVDIIDASNVERSLYLATQLMEMQVPLVLVFNMSDIAQRRGLLFDLEQLSKLLEVPIVSTTGNKGLGKQQLFEAIKKIVEEPPQHIRQANFGTEIEQYIEQLKPKIEQKYPELTAKCPSRWLAAKMLEQDEEILKKITDPQINQQAQTAIQKIKGLLGEMPEMIMADHRYGFISGACQETVKTTAELRHEFSDTIDAVVTNRYLGLPIFIGLMYLVFELVFRLGEYPMDWLEGFFGFLGAGVENLWPEGSMPWLKSLVSEGIIGGVGEVIVFLPNILLLFLAIAMLEGTGYMARAAFVMDKLMHKIGLHGKSFIPMLIGFGCSIPAIMGTRILEDRRNRLTTIMVIPLMSCFAKFTVYALLIPAFFPVQWRGTMFWVIYLIGILLGILSARILRSTVLKGEDIPFVMELPPYRMPTAKAMLMQMWTRAWLYIKKAGTIILAISILLWVGMNFPRPDIEHTSSPQLTQQQIKQLELEHSVVGRIGGAMEPAIKPLGFDRNIGIAMIGALAAKEVFVSQMAIVYAVEEDAKEMSLREQLRRDYSPLVGFAIMLFCLISAPCIATIAVTKHETNSWRWAGLQFFALTAMAYVITLLFYQIGSLFI